MKTRKLILFTIIFLFGLPLLNHSINGMGSYKIALSERRATHYDDSLEMDLLPLPRHDNPLLSEFLAALAQQQPMVSNSPEETIIISSSTIEAEKLKVKVCKQPSKSE